MRDDRTAARSDDPAAGLLRLIRDVSGLEFPDARRGNLDRRIDHALAEHGLVSVDRLEAFFRDPTNRVAREAFVASLTIGETHFFRNRPQLDALRDAVLPDLIERRATERRLRIWSAGCASGEEAYSLAMLIDALLPDRARWDILILATDINRSSLELAQNAVYGGWSFRHVTTDIMERYFTRRDQRYHLDPAIRQMVTYSYLNLVDDGYPSMASNTDDMDLILCRNVLIYFGQDTIRRVAMRLEQCLAPGGWLLPGHAETPMPVFRQTFEAHDFPMAVCFRKRSSLVDPSEPVPTAPPPADDLTRTPVVRALAPVPEPSPAVIDNGPSDAVAAALYACDSGRTEDALAMLDRLIHTTADGEAALSKARILASQVRLDEAEAAAQCALERDPMGAEAHYVLGLIHQEQGLAERALESLRRAVYLDPGLVLGRFSLAVMFAATGQIARAGKELDTLAVLLDDRDDEALIDGGDGVTVGRLRALAAAHRELIAGEGTHA
jgi:chemotaxis protein methyltransferase CheR